MTDMYGEGLMIDKDTDSAGRECSQQRGARR